MSILTTKYTQNLLVEDQIKLEDEVIFKDPYDLFYGVITNFKSRTSIFAYIFTNEILLKDELLGVWENDDTLTFNDIVPLDKTETSLRSDGVFFRVCINLQ